MSFHGFLEVYKIVFVSDLARDLTPEAGSRHCEGPPSLPPSDSCLSQG